MDDEINTEPEGADGLWRPRQRPDARAGGTRVHDIEEMKRITELLDRMEGGSQVRRIAEGILARNTTEVESLTPIIQPLLRPNRSAWRKRQVAAWILGVAKLNEPDRQFAGESLSKILVGRLDPDFSAVARVAAKWSVLTSLLLALPARNIFWSSYEHVRLSVAATMVFMATFPVTLVATAIHNRVTSRLIAAEAARALGNLRATEALDVLVTAAQTGRRRARRMRGNRRIRQAAEEALPAVLGTLTEEHYGNIHSTTMQGLARLLQSGDEALAIAILQALAHIGDTTVLSTVEKLAAGSGRAGVEPRVHTAAQAVLPAIQSRVARARDARQLLRGASMPITPTEQLLRPSTETSITDPMELLRASADPNWKGTENEVAFVVQILQELQRNGDTRALLYVERIAEATAIDARIRTAAHECLPVLRAHRELERYSPRPAEAQSAVVGLERNS